jgi:hypothetical protein
MFGLLFALAAIVHATQVVNNKPIEHTPTTHSTIDRSAIASFPAFKDTAANETIFFAAAAYCMFWQQTPDWSNTSTCLACVNASQSVSNLVTLRSPNDIFGFSVVDHSRKQIVISFKGTDPWDFWNWLVNLNTLRMGFPPLPQALVHQGFYGAYASITPNVTTVLSQSMALFPHYDVLVTGHSLGCALAIFAFLEILEQDLAPASSHVTLYGYGCPRVGDDVFQQYVQALVNARPDTAFFRIVHNQDIVPHVPPQYAGFTHAPTEVWFDEPMAKFTVCNRTNGEDPACSDGLWLKDSIVDHAFYYDIRVGGHCSLAAAATHHLALASARADEAQRRGGSALIRAAQRSRK